MLGRHTATVLLLLSFTIAAPVIAQDDPLVRARAALARGDFQLAEKELGGLKTASVEATFLRTRLLLWTGRYEEAAKTAKKGAGDANAKRQLTPWLAEALARLGKVDDAIKALRDLESDPDAHRAHLLLGELLIESGKRREGEQVLTGLVSAYNSDAFDGNPEGLSLVARAAYLLRAYADANDAFDQAEKAGALKRVETLLWRAELYLDKYDPGHAAQVVTEASKLAPGDPRVMVAAAHVKLAQTMAFGEAEKLIDRALKIDPRLAEAYFVRAGLALRTMDIKAADAATDAGLKVDPNDLALLSMRAATRFLDEDTAEVQRLEKRVLELNPEYSTFYAVVGEYAEWEHRYDEIVELMNKAVKVDAMDAKAYAALGLNLIRNGDDQRGVDILKKAWKRDKYNVRVFNTLELFDEIIPKEYVTVDGARFRIRYHKADKPVLERYLPRMLEEAWGSMVKRYGFTPSTPVAIELYADEEHFSVRTSGLPNVGIQGVCFGKTLAALSPSAGSFNWGNIVWHELAHVFHIQMSKNRVPRWLSEGLAEYETIIRRPEWQKEEHRALFHGLRDQRVPKVASFNRAFTHVDNPADVTMAYFAATEISVFLAETFGFGKIAAQLLLYKGGKHTPEVVQEALGISADELDTRFRAWLAPRLGRYHKQYVPDLRVPDSLEGARKDAQDHAGDAGKLVKLALALLAEGQQPEAEATLKLALSHDAKHKDAHYVQLQLAMRKNDRAGAQALVKRLLAEGGDGYSLRMKAADLAETKGDTKTMRKHLLRAHGHDPSQAEPLQGLVDLALKEKDEGAQLQSLRQLAKLEQHDRKVWQRLLVLLVKRGEWEEARALGESAMYVDVMSPEIHVLYARALARTGRQVSAIFELNSALLAGPKPGDAAAIYRTMAVGYKKLGKPDYAKTAERYASQMADAARAPQAPP